MTKLTLFKFRFPTNTDTSKLGVPEPGALGKEASSATSQSAKARKATALMTDKKNEEKVQSRQGGP